MFLKGRIVFIFLVFCSKIFGQTDLAVGNLSMLTNEVQSGCDLSATEEVAMVVFNASPIFFFGDIDLSYELNGAVVTENLTGISLAPGVSLNYTFIQRADLSAENVYNFRYWINTATDVNVNNDTLENHTIICDLSNIPGTLNGDLYACGNESLGLDLTGVIGNGFNWQVSLDSINWSNIGFVDQASINQAPSVDSVFVRVFFEGGLCSDTSSNTVLLSRVDSPDFTFNMASFCENTDTSFYNFYTKFGTISSVDYYNAGSLEYTENVPLGYILPNQVLVDSIVFRGNNLACGPFNHGFALDVLPNPNVGFIGRLNICPATMLDTLNALNYVADSYAWLIYNQDSVFQSEVTGQDYVSSGMFTDNAFVRFVAINACGADTSKYAEVKWLDIADVLSIQDYTIEEGDSVLVDLFDPVLNTLVWENNTNATQETPFSYWVGPDTDTQYPFTINYGTCVFADTIYVFVIPSEGEDPGIVVSIDDLVIPNGITPNNDGYNDDFRIPLLESFVVDVTIYNKYGHQVFQSLAHQNEMIWDGYYNGKCASGAYFVILHFKNEGRVMKKTLNIFGVD